jgi:hypothetical protein
MCHIPSFVMNKCYCEKSSQEQPLKTTSSTSHLRNRIIDLVDRRLR